LGVTQLGAQGEESGGKVVLEQRIESLKKPQHHMTGIKKDRENPEIVTNHGVTALLAASDGEDYQKKREGKKSRSYEGE